MTITAKEECRPKSIKINILNTDGKLLSVGRAVNIGLSDLMDLKIKDLWFGPIESA